MGDSYWNRQVPLHPSAGVLKRHRSDFELPPSEFSSGHELHNFLGQDEERGGVHALKDSKSIGSAYDRYLQSVQVPPLSSGEASNFGGVGLGRTVSGGMPGLSRPESAVMGRSGGVSLDLAANTRGMGFGGPLPVDPVARPGRETAPLPHDATNTLYVEGFPPDSTKREVAHIFRPFVGYREVRLVTKESKHRGGDPLILCFVDFMNPACAATALSALQGYKMDENDIDSPFLRLQFSRFPGPRSGPGNRGKR